MAKNKIAVALTAILGALTLNAQTRLHDIFEMNSSPATLNSHAGEEMWSRLQPIHSYTRLISNTFLLGGMKDFDAQKHLCSYPRIKRNHRKRAVLNELKGGISGKYDLMRKLPLGKKSRLQNPAQADTKTGNVHPAV